MNTKTPHNAPKKIHTAVMGKKLEFGGSKGLTTPANVTGVKTKVTLSKASTKKGSKKSFVF